MLRDSTPQRIFVRPEYMNVPKRKPKYKRAKRTRLSDSLDLSPLCGEHSLPYYGMRGENGRESSRLVLAALLLLVPDCCRVSICRSYLYRYMFYQFSHTLG